MDPNLGTDISKLVTFRLQPENDAMEPILVPKNTPFSIVGKVIGLFRIFK